MNTQTSLVAEQVRLRQWAEQIKDCQNRPADMKVPFEFHTNLHHSQTQ